MPVIQTELRVQVEGGRIPLLVKRTSLQVSSCEELSLTVEGVPPAPTPKPPAAGKKAGNNRAPKKQPAPRLMKATYQPPLANVRFVAIYDRGQASGLRVKVGSAKGAPLTQPLIYADRAATGLGSRPRIVLENASATPRTAYMLVGSDLPKTAHKSELVDGSRAVARKKSSTKKSKTKNRKTSKKKTRK